MKTKMLSQSQPINSGRLLFAPRPEDLLPLLMDGIKDGDDLMRYFGSHDSAVFHAMDYLIMNYHIETSGKLTLEMMFDAIKTVGESYEMANHFWSKLSPANNHYNVNYREIESNDTCIATGILTEDYIDGDSDCYQTAGGYRSWIALKGSQVSYMINPDLSITAEFDSNCILDHYNNNFFGVSTGGGDTKYEIGKRIEKRHVKMGREFLDKRWTKSKLNAQVTGIDVEKAKSLSCKFIPEFSFIFNK